MLIINDISEKKRVNDLQKANEYKDTVLATVTHDLKTPLNSIVTQSELAL